MTTLAGELDSLDSDEPLARRRRRHWYDRLMMLSDGVFAIAMTLLAAQISLTASWAGDWKGLWAQLAWQLDAYAVSSLVISIYWLAHRRFMAMVLAVDAPVTVLNLVALSLVALLPAATRLVSVEGAHPPAKAVYAALVILIGLALASMWAYAALIAKLVSPEVTRRLRWFYLLLMLWTPGFFLVLTLTIINPRRGTVPFVLAVLFLLGWRLRLLTVRRLGGVA